MITLELAPLIETGGFVPDATGSGAMLFAGDGAPPAAIGRSGAGEAAAAGTLDGEMLFDLFVDARPGYVSEGAEWTAQDMLASTSWRGWLLAGDAGEASLSGDGPGMDEKALRAAFDDVDGDGEKDEPITVTGRRPTNVGTGEDTGGAGGGGDYPGGPSGGGSGPSDPVAEETPCVEASPSNVDLQQLNNQALKQSNDIALRNDEMWEYGVIFYIKDGVLQNTGIFGGDQSGDINWNLGIPLVPSDAIIVAILHNHPDESGTIDGIPSLDTMQNRGGTDWEAFDSFLSVADRNSRGITTDANLLMYIYTNEDHKTRAYDKTDRNTTRKSCSLQG